MAEGTPKRCAGQAVGIALRYLLLFGAFFVYVLLAIDTRIIYDRYIPVSMRFSRTWDAFKGMFDETGGLVAYAAGFLHQYYCYAWLGALILTLVAAALAAGVDGWLPVRSRSWLRLLSFVPALGLLAAANQIDLKFRNPGGPLLYALGLLLALIAANIHAHWPSRRLPIRIALGLILAALVYHAGGWFYTASYGVGETERHTYLPGPLLILIALVVLREVWLRVFPPPAPVARAGKKAPERSALVPVGIWLLQLAVLAGAGAATAHATQSPNLKASWRLDFCRQQRHWADFLEEARKITPEQFDLVATNTPLAAMHLTHDINRALYDQGLLLDEMFTFRQMRGALLLVDRRGRTSDFVRADVQRYADAFFELGHVNFAEHAAHELLQVDGDRPSTLRLLAEVNIVKDERPAAQTFLGYLRGLRNSPPDECWADGMLEHYRRHGEFPLDPRLQRIRDVNLREDYIQMTPTVHDDLLRLLKSNPDNRMAFEYMVADCLLSDRIEDVLDHLDRFEAFGYKSLPKHVQEALLRYCMRPDARVSRDRFTFDVGVRRRFDRLVRTEASVRKRGGTYNDFLRVVARDPEFSRTYYWYVLSTFTPVKGAGR